MDKPTDVRRCTNIDVKMGLNFRRWPNIGRTTGCLNVNEVGEVSSPLAGESHPLSAAHVIFMWPGHL